MPSAWHPKRSGPGGARVSQMMSATWARRGAVGAWGIVPRATRLTRGTHAPPSQHGIRARLQRESRSSAPQCRRMGANAWQAQEHVQRLRRKCAPGLAIHDRCVDMVGAGGQIHSALGGLGFRVSGFGFRVQSGVFESAPELPSPRGARDAKGKRLNSRTSGSRGVQAAAPAVFGSIACLG
jgi:hypothetical protein